MSQQSHRSDPRILSRRTLEHDHQCLARLLRPGMAVLDGGCGTGAITAGIAHRVGPAGSVVGVDRDSSLLAIAREEHAYIANLTFEETDILAWSFSAEFDIVNAARTLQWIGDPAGAIRRMVAAARTRGSIVVLDYDHTASVWEPDPPKTFQSFYDAFLTWRSANNWDNQIAKRLDDLFRHAGLVDVEIHCSDEVRTQPEHDIWLPVIQSIGPQVQSAGFAFDPRAEADYEEWLRDGFRRQILVMKTAIGTVPAVF